MSVNKRYFDSSHARFCGVTYEVLDKNGKHLAGENNIACFTYLTYNPLPEGADRIVVTEPLSNIGYSEESITRWITDIDSLGFPCKVKLEDDKAVFTLSLSDYKWKRHLGMTLQLLRALYEHGVYYVPEAYFRLLDAGAKDKFDALQTAHKSLPPHAYANTNHMCTYKGNGDNVDLPTLFQRLESSNLPLWHPYYQGFGNHNIDEMWHK
jgi:hypothetical protein